MARWKTILIAALLITYSQAKNKNSESNEMTPNKLTYRYITNWNAYDLPAKVPVIVLKDILESVALYKQDIYCPYGGNGCDLKKVTMKEIISKIVNDSIDSFNLNNPDGMKTRKNIRDEDIVNIENHILTNGKVKKVQKYKDSTLLLKEMLSKVKDDDLENIILVAENLHNQELDVAKNAIQKLYGAKYENLKSKHKTIIKKHPFDPYLVHPGKK